MYLNKVYILGNLTRDPELKSLPSGIQVATFGLATNRVYRDRDGNKQEAPDFHNVVVFSRQAELCAQFLRKGAQALVEGRLQTRSWEQDGQKKYRTEIVAERVQFGTRPNAGEYGGAPAQPSARPAPAAKPDAIEYPEEDIDPNDIPF